MLGEASAVPRICDLAHLHSTAIGKLELDLMGSHQLDEARVLDAVIAEAVATVFKEIVDDDGLEDIASIFGKGVRIEVGDLVPSSNYAALMDRVPKAWTKAMEVNRADDPAVRASCVEFVLAGLHATDRISRSQRFGKTLYESGE
jgi:magnesium chelatase subunit I